MRGSALAETGLVVGLALLVIFNAFELALLGFYQLHADAAAFLAARVQSLSDSATAQLDLRFTLPSTFTTTQAYTLGTATSQAVVTHRWDGMLLVPGSGGATLTGAHIEPVATQSSVTSGFAFSVAPSVLPNWFPQGDVDDPAASSSKSYTTLYLAQNFGSSNGNGWNGAFDEWQTHAKCFSNLNFPANYADTQSATTASGYLVDPKTNPWSNFPAGSVENTIYGWDAPQHTGSC